MIRLSTIALAAALMAAPLPALASEVAAPPSLSLSADGIVSATPDTAIVTTGVVTEAETAGAALTGNNAAMRQLIDAVTGAGVEKKDVATSGFSIEPVMVYPQPKADGTQDPPHITGYRVANQVTVKIRKIEAAGDLLDKVVRAGANQVQGVSFTVEDSAALLDRARAEAMRKARAKAEVYAAAGGFKLGRILSISEGTGFMPPPAPYARMVMAEAAPADKVPVALGEQQLQVTVSATWEIQEAR